MKIRNEICDLIDRGEKGYITIGDICIATFFVGIIIAIPYLLYCGLPIWKGILEDPYFMFSNFSFIERIGYVLSICIISCSITAIIIFGALLIGEISTINVYKCRRKEK